MVYWVINIPDRAACYIGETTRHFSTRVREHLEMDRVSHIFKHLKSWQFGNLAIIDQVSLRFAL